MLIRRVSGLILAAAGMGAAAFAQGAPATTPAPPSMLVQLFPILVLIPIFYFLLIRPQQQRAKRHTDMIAGLKRGDTVVTSGGFIGKINKVTDDEVLVDLADNVRVRVVKSMIAEVRNNAQQVAAAND
jgi:preprotein translocase subunit YajC